MALGNGAPFHGEFSSADASALSEANSRFALYGQGGTTALALNANDYVSIAQITISSGGTNLTVQVYDGADATVDAGEEVHGGVVATNTTINLPLLVFHTCQKGTYPKLKASGSGAVRAQIRGTIYRHGS